MKYYISDLHLFHENAIKFDHRPFESVQEMHEVVLKNWNDRVTNGDFVYLLGDMSLRGKNEDLIAFVARLKGRKVLIRGNHDDVSDYRYQQLFTEICDYKEIYDSVGKEKYGLETFTSTKDLSAIEEIEEKATDVDLGKTWDVEKFCCMDIHMKVKKTGFIKTV